MPPRYPLSIVIPVHNEEAVLSILFNELETTCSELLKAYSPIEIVLVDDGSTDRSWEIIEDQCQRRTSWIGVQLSRNFGHQSALVAGLEIARGESVVTMDADMQDPPALILQMLDAQLQGYDVVYATRRERGEESFTKHFTAHLFYFLIRKISGVPIPANTGDFRLLSRRALTELCRLKETHRFLRGMVPWIGFPQTQVHYDRDDRAAGETHYPFRKMLRLAFDGIASMSAAPLRLAYILSLLLFSVFVGYIIFVIIKHTVWGGVLVPGWISIMSAITIFGTIQLILLGVFGEYLGRIYEQSKNRPLYIIQSIAQSQTTLLADKRQPHQIKADQNK